MLLLATGKDLKIALVNSAQIEPIGSKGIVQHLIADAIDTFILDIELEIGLRIVDPFIVELLARGKQGTEYKTDE
jgi:hypothetical protein